MVEWVRLEVLPVGTVRILHCADFHLDRPFRGLDPDRARQRVQELLATFRRTVALALERQVQVLLIVGDLFEHRWVRPETVRTVAAELARFGRPTFIAPGNHDPRVANSYYNTFPWPPNVHIFGPEWEAVPLPDLGVTVWGIGFDRWEVPDPPLAALRVQGEGLHLAVVHGSVLFPGHRPEEEVYAPIPVADLLACGAHYVALGHYHSARVAAWRDGVAVARYPGSPEGLDFGQQGDHGVLVGEVAPDRVDLELVPVGLRRYVRAQVDITGCGTAVEVAERILAAFPAEDRERHLFRITLTGRHRPGLDVRPQELCQELAPAFYSLELESAAGPDYDLAALAQGRDLRGAFVRRVQAALAGASDRERRRLERALYLGLEAMDREG